METIAGMRVTGRRLAGPGVELVEVVDDGDLKHVAIVVAAPLRDHPSLHAELEFGLGFMEQPDVTGLVRLARHSPEEGAFVYATGTVWSVAELVRALASVGEAGGVKAGLELCYMAGEILVEAADQSVHSGLDGHGSVDPWKLVIKPDGQVSIIGYGVPRPEIELFLDDDTRMPGEDSLRYCAPESLREEAPRDLSADLFSLSLIALELMMGKPVYDGLVADVRQQAARGEAARRLYQWRERLPTTVREVLGKALKPDRDIRYRDGLDFVYSVHDLLGGIDAGDGPSLRELVTRVRSRQARGQAVVGGNTGALTPAELAELAADIDAAGVVTDLPAPRRPRPTREEEEGERPRWQPATRNRGDRAARRGRRAPAEAPAPPPAEEPAGASARSRLLRRLRDREEPELPRRRPTRMPGDDVPLTTIPPDADPDTGRVVATEPPRRRAPEPPRGLPEPPRRRTAESLPPEAPDVTESPTRRRRPGGRAAALLERLRSSSGGSIPEVEERPRRGRDPSAAVAAPTLEPAPAVEAHAPARGAAPPAPAPIQPDDPPAQVAAASPGGEVELRHEGRRVVLARGDATAGDLAARAAAELGLGAFDLLGSRLYGWRVVADGAPVRPSAPASTLPDRCELRALPNAPVLLDVLAPGGVRTRVAVGAAVPFRQLAVTLARLVDAGAPVELWADGQRLAPDDAPVDLPEPRTIEVRP